MLNANQALDMLIGAIQPSILNIILNRQLQAYITLTITTYIQRHQATEYTWHYSSLGRLKTAQSRDILNDSGLLGK